MTYLLSAKTLHTRSLVLFALILALAAGHLAAFQDSGSSERLTPQEMLAQELEIEKAKADIAEARKRRLDAEFPAEVDEIPGKTTVDDNLKIEAEILAYDLVGDLADRIAEAILGEGCTTGARPAAPLGIDRILIEHDSILSNLELHKRFVEHRGLILGAFDQLQSEKRDRSPEEFAGGITIASGLARSTIDFLSLFRTETEFRGRQITIEDSSLITELIDSLHRCDSELIVVHPGVFLRASAPSGGGQGHGLFSTMLEEKGLAQGVITHLADQIQALSEQRTMVNESLAAFQTDIAESKKLFSDLDAQLADPDLKDKARRAVKEKLQRLSSRLAVEYYVSPEPGISHDDAFERGGAWIAFFKKLNQEVRDQWRRQADGLSAKIAGLRNLSAEYGAFVTLVDQFVSAFTRTADDGSSLFDALLKGEWLDRQIQTGTYVLLAESVATGGSYRIRRNVFTLFTGPRLSFSAGAVVSFTLIDPVESAVVKSGLLSAIHPYESLKSYQARLTAKAEKETRWQQLAARRSTRNAAAADSSAAPTTAQSGSGQ